MREVLRELFTAAIEAVDPAELTARALTAKPPATKSVIAIGKAAPAMIWGARYAMGPIEGICVATEAAAVPDGIEVIVGDHPVPGDGSFEAGRRALQVAGESVDGCLILVSGGGSSLCEWPRSGVDRTYVQEVNRRLLLAGSSIRETNIVRGHLSAIKCGGLARAGTGPFPTYILSDVAGEGPEVVASGPTLPMDHQPGQAREILQRIDMEIPATVWEAMSSEPPQEQTEHVTATVVGDGMTAAHAMAERAAQRGIEARIATDWLTGETRSALDRLLTRPETGLTIAAGETTVSVPAGGGRGGRNTHAALLAATRISGTDWMFGAFATDGVDGTSQAAGAIVDGETLSRGGDPSLSLEEFDSAGYLDGSGDLVVTGPTGTNVADLWVLWRP